MIKGCVKMGKLLITPEEMKKAMQDHNQGVPMTEDEFSIIKQCYNEKADKFYVSRQQMLDWINERGGSDVIRTMPWLGHKINKYREELRGSRGKED